MLTPSVFITNEISEGLLLGHKKPPGIACLEYSLPLHISFIDELGLGLALSRLQKLLSAAEYKIKVHITGKNSI